MSEDPSSAWRREFLHAAHASGLFYGDRLVEELKAQRRRLRERAPEVEAPEAREAAPRVQSYMLPEGRELELVLRYEAALDRKLRKSMDRLDRVQADRRATEAVTDDGGSRPATH